MTRSATAAACCRWAATSATYSGTSSIAPRNTANSASLPASGSTSSRAAWSSNYLGPGIDAALALFEQKVAGDGETGPAPKDRLDPDLPQADWVGARVLARDLLRRPGASEELSNLASCFLGLDDHTLEHDDTPPTTRTREVLRRLFDQAPKLEGAPDQAPAFEAHVLLRGAPMQFSGILSTTPEGGLRLMTPTKENGKPIMIEQFFDYSDVTSVAVVREVTASTGSRIITS